MQPAGEAIERGTRGILTYGVATGGAVGVEPRDHIGAVSSGPVLFARYAFGPNRLGLCGPEDWRSLLELGAAGSLELGAAGGLELSAAEPAALSHSATLDVDRGLRELAAGFEGAYPYLRLIADAHGIADALDVRVVDAYWIGNALSDTVDPILMTRSMDDRFRRQLGGRAWQWLEGKPEAGARPTHAFHVLDVFPQVGASRGNAPTDVVALMDSCRIRWGPVRAISADELVVETATLEVVGGKLHLGTPHPLTVRRWLDGTGFISRVAVGDIVSIHWDWACEVLSPARRQALETRTQRQIALANQTI